MLFLCYVEIKTLYEGDIVHNRIHGSTTEVMYGVETWLERSVQKKSRRKLGWLARDAAAWRIIAGFASVKLRLVIDVVA